MTPEHPFHCTAGAFATICGLDDFNGFSSQYMEAPSTSRRRSFWRWARQRWWGALSHDGAVSERREMDTVLEADAYRRALRSIRLVQAQLPEIVNLLRPLWRPEEAVPAAFATADEVLARGRPVRRIVKKSTVRRVGYFASRKNAGDGALAWESELEKHALWLLEVDPYVSRFITQPLKVGYSLGGKPREHTPDLWFWRKGVPYLVEIKPSWRVKRPWMGIRTELMKELFAEYGIRYRLWRDDEIRSEPRLSNARNLLRYRDQELLAADKLKVRAALEAQTSMTIGELARLVSHEVVLGLLARGRLLMDMHEPLSKRSCVWLKPRQGND